MGGFNGTYIKKWANPGLFFFYFRSFQTNITIFTTNIFEKMSIQYTVPGPLERESLPITTRPGLPPMAHTLPYQSSPLRFKRLNTI